MLKVGIFAPYTRSEVTLAAVQLADWLLRCGIEVIFIAEDRVGQGIHPVWDCKVISAKTRNVYKWATNATHLCWFSPHSYALSLTTLVAKTSGRQRIQHIFFPTWGNWTADHEFFALTSDRTICLSRDMANWLDARYDKEKTNRTWANLVSPSTIVVPKQGLTNKDQRRLLAVCSQAFDLDLGSDFVNEFAVLLQISDLVHITFLLDKSVPRNYRQRFNELKKYFPGRVQIVKNIPYYDYVQLARQHDWIYLTSTRYTYGSLLSLLLSSSVPVICHDISPTSAHISNGTTGILIPCESYNKTAPVAAVASETAMSDLSAALHFDESTLKTFQHNLTGQLQRKQSAFQKFLLKEFVQ